MEELKPILKKEFKTRDFFLLVVETIIATKIWLLSIWFIFRNNPEFLERIITDSIHHYYVGLLLLLLAYPLRTLIKPSILSAIGLGIVWEEWPVFLNDLGLGTVKYYNSGWDILLILVVTLFIYKLLSLARKPN